jgi:hypothetical protein
LPIDQRPKPEQSASVCSYCAHVGVFCERNGRLALRTPDGAELAALFDRSPALLTEAMLTKARLS